MILSRGGCGAKTDHIEVSKLASLDVPFPGK